MSTVTLTPTGRVPLRSRFACMSLFFASGLLYATWGIHIPTIRERFGLSGAGCQGRRASSTTPSQ